ncbi:precorrin-2 dehydrogenase/sirohydrochlorin ferrochelatase family protein [Halalkalibacter krulwichiae]|uniref:precorrin-2 dehydrogenase n=1 Tax=Halalkalibacter krulwichiae TaxID=199441 RepID=A0A1X9MD15_9BACI|nr:bifunctional precorrin-2 dehydrogenase/sirohydrochlorin ferrochelatase [Halalkalibacter krulwichiae]ARK29451.1 Precorrin-2 dehydrogenase [Halalkalibacter krulwichiae]
MSNLPLNFNLKGRRAAVIGGGAVASRQVPKLLEAEIDDVLVYSPELHQDLQAYLPRIKWVQGKVNEDSTFDEDLLLLTTNDSSLHLAIFQQRKSYQLVYLADNPELSDFSFPKTIRKGPLAISASTGGVSPSYLKQLMTDIEQLMDSTIENDLRFLKSVREQVLNSRLPASDRKRLLNYVATKDFLRSQDRDLLFNQLLKTYLEHIKE